MKKQRLKGKHKTRRIITITTAVMLLLPKGYLVYGETYEYDPLNRIQKVYYDDGSVASYSYDANGNIQNVRIETVQSQQKESTETEETTKTEEAAGSEEFAQEALNLEEDIEGTKTKRLKKQEEKNIFERIGEWFENIFQRLKDIRDAIN